MLVPGMSQHLVFDRAAVAAEPWRVLTGHFVHASLDHFAWDVGAFVVLCLLAESIGRWRCVVCVGASALLVPAVLVCALPGLTSYCGLSGIDSALFSLVAAALLRRSSGERAAGVLTALLSVLFVVKLGYECSTGATLFVDPVGIAPTPVPLAHVVGAAVGAACGAWPDCARSGTRRCDGATASTS